MTKQSKPAVIGDAYRRCLVSSIAGYSQCEDGIILIQLKSGDKIELKFQVDYLADAAMKKLDSMFGMTVPEHDPCKICVRTDLEIPGNEPDKYCDYCTINGGGEEEFREPGRDPHEEEDDDD